MLRSRSCPHCGSPSRRNPCWWTIKHPTARGDGGDPPCIGDEYDEYFSKRDAGSRRVWIALVIAAAVLIIGWLIWG